MCRPGLLLPVIKYLVFFNTFVFANSIFFATQFGRHSCFFSRTGFQGWVPISWWVRLLYPRNRCTFPRLPWTASTPCCAARCRSPGESAAHQLPSVLAISLLHCHLPCSNPVARRCIPPIVLMHCWNGYSPRSHHQSS